MRFRNLFGIFSALVFAFCLFACNDTVSSTDSSDRDGLDAIPGFNVNQHSSGGEVASSSGGSSSSLEGSSASEESSSSVEEESSSSGKMISAKPRSSSSRFGISSSIIGPVYSSSSSVPSLPPISSSSVPSLPPISSSSVYSMTASTCGPDKSVVEKDEEVTWRFNNDLTEFPNSLMLNANFNWTTPDGDPPSATIRGYKGVTHKVSYATSGKHSAILHIDANGTSYDLTCLPAHMNGDPITGCKCATAAASVDYTSTPDVAWSVTGCTTASVPLTYNWDGVDGGVTFIKSFCAPTASYAPVLKVGNTDNTVIEVTCPAVKVTDGPSYEIVAIQNAGAIKLPAGTSTVALKVDAYNNTVFCNVSRDDSPSGALNGTVNGTTIKGNDYILVPMPAGTLVNGATLEFNIDEPATCGVL